MPCHPTLRPLPTVPRGPTPPPDTGQATPLMAAGVVLAAVLVLALVGWGGVAIDAARARTAADAAALAGAAEGRSAAARLAGQNGGRLVGFRRDGDDVVVEVTVGDADATARARREGTWCRSDASSEAPVSYTSPPCPSTPG